VLVLGVKTTSRGVTAYDKLFALHEGTLAAIEKGEDVVFDFSECGFFHQHGVAFLAGLTRLLQAAGRTVYVKGLKGDVRKNLGKNGFLHKLLGENPVSVGNAIPFRQDNNADGLMAYLREDWLGRGWVHVSNKVQDAIATAVWEIYSNAFEHGASSVGVFTCGQHYPQMHVISLTVVDFGAGIPGTVRTVRGMEALSDENAIIWALQPGTTSKQGNRGVGLNLFWDFVKLNGGSVDLLSHHGIVRIAGGKIEAKRSKRRCPGTLLNITLKTDERLYVFADEITDSIL
jgi:anti-sigma regulatory factor (Ser/Thr protein kinase)